ncbi:MAG: TonB-dependent receptor [Flavobacteriales bacterium]|nr:TonB-dependent receptor [Flavobacteriales bacterium]
MITLAGNASDGVIKGVILSEGTAVAYANVGLEGTSLGNAADVNGHFEITSVPAGTYTLFVSAVGYGPLKKDVTIRSGEVVQVRLELQELTNNLQEVVVTGTMKETFVSESPVKVEVLTPKFLQANPTNNVIEALQTVNGVQEQINCGVCGTNDIHINGMEGPYTLVLIDGMPIMSALATVYGFNGIPISLIRRVEIIKGPSSTLYGTEAVGGVINIITKRPEDMDLITFNTFYTSHRESSTDISITPFRGKKLSTTVSGNFYRNQYRMDFNRDNFTDIPLNERVTVYNKWNLKRKDDRAASLAFRYYYEDRFGGVLNWQDKDRGSDNVYGESIETKRWELIGTYQLPLKEVIRLDYSMNGHHQDSYYGTTHYKADQSVYFANLIWNKVLSNHDLLMGTTAKYQLYEDNSLANTNEAKLVHGLFLQDDITIRERTHLLAGIRLDHHQEHGVIMAPRLSMKYKVGTYSTARLNMGTGFREVHLFTEDHAALTGARTVLITEKIKPEESYNATTNFNQVYNFIGGVGTLDLDAFYTYYTNKIIPDYETDENLIIYDNLDGYGITRGFAFNVQQQFKFPLKMNVGATFQDVYEMAPDVNGISHRVSQLFAPVVSGTFGVGYEWKKKGWSTNLTGRVMGPQHLPAFAAPFDRPVISPWYTLQNVQVTKVFDCGVEVYGGVKNIWNYTQPSPLVDPAHPFGDRFDTSYAYGPLQVRRFFVGLRFSLKELRMKSEE